MKYIRQTLIILLISFVGELLRHFIPLPIPASIYGLLIMLVALMKGLIKLEQVKETGIFLIEIMPIMFIPAAVGLLESWHVLKPICIPLIIITILTTMIVMAVSGRVTQFVIRKAKVK